jgi:hypothetical protein
MAEESYFKSEIMEIIFYIFLAVVMTGLLPIFVGFVGKAFEESFVSGKALTFGEYFTTSISYTPWIIISLCVIIFPIAKLILIKRGEHPATQKNPNWMRMLTVSYIFAPEENGFLYYLAQKADLKKWMEWSKSIPRMIILGIIIFSIVGIFQSFNPNLQIAGLPKVQLQQVTVASEVLFSAEPPAWSETGTMLFVLCLLSGINAWFCARFRLGKGTFFAIQLLLVCPMVGLFWMGFHNIAYGNQEAKLFATFIFGWIGSTITVLFGTFLLWYIWHFNNNIFAKLSEVAPFKEDIALIAGVSIIVLFFIWMGIEYFRKVRRRN